MTSSLSALLCILSLVLATEAHAQASCPEECLAWADTLIPEGDELRIVHNRDQEAIAVSFDGVVIDLLSFKNTSPSVRLYQACYTGENSKIDDLQASEFAACRHEYTQTARELGVKISIE